MDAAYYEDLAGRLYGLLIGPPRRQAAARGIRPPYRLALRQAPVTAAGTGHPAVGLPPELAGVRHLARHQIMGLTGAFLLGMAVNLTGLPAQTSGGARIASIAFLAAHVLIALGLVIGAALLCRAAARAGGRRLGQATSGAAAITVTVAAGILTMLTASNWWSYAMAAGFITAFLIYGNLLIQPGHHPGRAASAVPPDRSGQTPGERGSRQPPPAGQRGDP